MLAMLPDGYSTSVEPICYVNGKRHVLPPGKAEYTLLQWLRGEFGQSESAPSPRDRLQGYIASS